MVHTVLFTRENSIYQQLGCDCWTKDRNIKNYDGCEPVIAHPPCRAWGKFKWRSKHEPGEKGLAIWSLQYINRYGGILEHPKSSDLWKHPEVDSGKIYTIQQGDFGHRGRKDTNLYIVGTNMARLKNPPILLGGAIEKVENLGKKDRESTPILLGTWLIQNLEIIKNEN